MKIQILLAAYNGEKYIETQLDSLIAQQMPPTDSLQILIADDMSTDGTPEILKEYHERYPSLIELLPLEREGSAMANFMRLLAESDGDIMFFCDQDDWWMPAKVIKMLEAFESTDQPQLVFSDAIIADENLKLLEVDESALQTYNRGLTLQKLLVQNYIMGCTMAVNRPLVNGVSCGSYPGMQMHDWWLAIYAMTFGGITHVNEKLMKYRQHCDNEVGAKDIKSGSYIRSHMNGGELRTKCGMLLEQASGFYECYGAQMSPDKQRIFTDFITLRAHSKLSRIATQISGGYLKSTFARTIGQLIYM